MRLTSTKAGQRWRRILLSTDFAVVVIVVATFVVLVGPAQAPIDAITYTMSYADGQVREHRWTEEQAQQLVQMNLAGWLPALVPPLVALVAGSGALLGVQALLRRRLGRTTPEDTSAGLERGRDVGS